MATPDAGVCLPTCPPNQGFCDECPLNTYKGTLGPGPCLDCPAGSNTSMEGQSDCTCGTLFYANRSGVDNRLISCLPCPEHSGTENSEGTTISDCKCDQGY